MTIDKKNKLHDDLSKIMDEIIKNGRYLKEPEWTNDIIRDKEIVTVDQDGEIRKVICRKHNIEKVRKRGELHPNMSPYREYWIWRCPECEKEYWDNYFKNY